MDTPRLDEKINDLEILSSAGELNSKGNEALIEFKAIKLALNIQNVMPRDFGMVRWYSNVEDDVACVSIEKAKEYVKKYNELSGKQDCYVDEEIYKLLNEA